MENLNNLIVLAIDRFATELRTMNEVLSSVDKHMDEIEKVFKHKR